MDDDNGRVRTPTDKPGGTVEPAKRVDVVKEKYQTLVDPSAVRYELRDPLADLTYRATKQADIVAKAEQLGSTRFTAIDAEGRRTPIRKIDGAWQALPKLPALQPAPDHAVDDESERKDAPRTAPHIAVNDARSADDGAKAPSARALARVEAEGERAATVARLEAALKERYVVRRAAVVVNDVTVGRMEYRYRGDTTRIAFTESTFKLATNTNNPSVARSMVDVAEARNWKALRVSGNEEFKRLVWLEASIRGVRALGYEPSPTDLDLARRERDARAVNRIELDKRESQSPGAATAAASPGAEKPSARGNGGRKAVLAAIDAVLTANRVPVARREAVLTAAADQLAMRLKQGQKIEVKLYDKGAPSRRPAPVPKPELQRSRERAAPAPAR